MQLPRFLEELKPIGTIELLHCKRDKGAWKVGFSSGDGILVLDVPDDDQGRKDTTEALRAVADAIDRDPAAQLGLFAGAKPEPLSAAERTATLPHIDPEQTSLPITEVDDKGQVTAGALGSEHPKTDRAPPPQGLSEEEIAFRSPPKGKLPRDCACIFDHGGGAGDEQIELRAGDNVLRWEPSGKPEFELLSVTDLHSLTNERNLRPIYAVNAVQGVWVFRWNGELRAFERLQATGKKRRT